jgi:hypothetical protein
MRHLAKAIAVVAIASADGAGANEWNDCRGSPDLECIIASSRCVGGDGCGRHQGLCRGRVGIAVLQQLAYDPSRDVEIAAIAIDYLIPLSTAKLIVNRTKFLRRYMFDFIKVVAPRWTPNKVREALNAS